jgi:hypothetical protein
VAEGGEGVRSGVVRGNGSGVLVWVRGAGLVLNLPVMLGMALLAWWRETPRFWTNAGGYPVALRNFVLVGYPLVLGLELVLLSWMSVALVRLRRDGDAGVRLCWVLLLFQWAWMALVLAVLIGDNLMNLLEGRPWHWAPS